MLAEIRRQSVVKQILLLAGVGVTAFWLGSRVLSVPKNNAALRPADAGHVVAVDSRVETQTGIPRPFSPPRIDGMITANRKYTCDRPKPRAPIDAIMLKSVNCAG